MLKMFAYQNSIYMKSLFSLFSLVAITSCAPTPEKPSLDEGYWGEASALRNGETWRTNPACWISQIDKTTLIVQLDSFIDKYYYKEGLIINGIPPQVGTYPVKKFKGNEINLHSVLSMWDYDLPLGGYHLLESDSNTNRVTLLSYDTLTRELTGSFNLSFLVSGRPYPSYPDTIRFTNGFFHGRLEKK
jgi:hypothetical protein